MYPGAPAVIGISWKLTAILKRFMKEHFSSEEEMHLSFTYILEMPAVFQDILFSLVCSQHQGIVGLGGLKI